MASNISICNEALTSLGADRILALDQNNENARRCNAIFEQTRDELISSHPWNFAIARVALAQLSTTPDFDYSIEYQLPSDCLRVLKTNIADLEFKIEGGKLLCDDTGVSIKYIKRITDPTKFSVNFVEALTAKIAAKLAYAILESKTQAETAIKLYMEAITDAKSADSQEGTPDDFRDGDWIDSRSE